MLCHNYASVSNAYNKWQTLTVIWKADTTTIKKKKKEQWKEKKEKKKEKKKERKKKRGKLDWSPHPPEEQ